MLTVWAKVEEFRWVGKHLLHVCGHRAAIHNRQESKRWIRLAVCPHCRASVVLGPGELVKQYAA